MWGSSRIGLAGSISIGGGSVKVGRSAGTSGTVSTQFGDDTGSTLESVVVSSVATVVDVSDAVSSSSLPVTIEMTTIPAITTTTPIPKRFAALFRRCRFTALCARFARLRTCALLPGSLVGPRHEAEMVVGTAANPFRGRSLSLVPCPQVSLVVQKYGGTSVARPRSDPGRRRSHRPHPPRRRRRRRGRLGDGQDHRRPHAPGQRRRATAAPAGREMDMLLTAGERISMALLCMAVEALGVPAVSFTGSQAGILTDTDHGRAKILEVRADRIREALARAGSRSSPGSRVCRRRRDITTLGRGGSDTTAVALAAALERRRVRDLHRRRRRLQRRPAHRSDGAQARARLVRRDARDGGDGRSRARAAIGRVRA